MSIYHSVHYPRRQNLCITTKEQGQYLSYQSARHHLKQIIYTINRENQPSNCEIAQITCAASTSLFLGFGSLPYCISGSWKAFALAGTPLGIISGVYTSLKMVNERSEEDRKEALNDEIIATIRNLYYCVNHKAPLDEVAIREILPYCGNDVMHQMDYSQLAVVRKINQNRFNDWLNQHTNQITKLFWSTVDLFEKATEDQLYRELSQNTFQATLKNTPELFIAICEHIAPLGDHDEWTINIIKKIATDIFCTDHRHTQTILQNMGCFRFQQLLNDNPFYFTNRRGNDVFFQVENSMVEASRELLSRRSPVLQNQLQNKEVNTFTVDQFSLKNFQEFIAFLSDETVYISKDNFRSLLEISKEYQVEELKEVCEDYLKEVLNTIDRKELFSLIENYRLYSLGNYFYPILSGLIKKLDPDSDEFNQLYKDLENFPAFNRLTNKMRVRLGS